ncbi:hypothetical protein K466DRAFT_574048 [Polyporus arcularius HHB13444]|uniref:Methyltransferase domain-containing protein n=1 Tax=Polyporus arcularius HHB13444 TaxID=1314778 RepID=A0A5C3PLX9_9APHY|nr:hypothetical protein K466DRAFT_574048 [Polyporus arcularius HHB13444]
MTAPPLASSRQPRLSCSSTTTHTGSSEGRNTKSAHRKENQFVYRNGAKLHAYDRDKAPYPSSFDRPSVDLQCLDNALMLYSKGSTSFLGFDAKTAPKRCLDLGCGLGLWVISSAKAWPETTFVGVDMVNIQVPHSALDPDIADRIEWTHTNILRNKLPYDDEEFDFVHVSSLALGIPENKWHSLFEEIRRVMKPGAVIEMVEEDAIFPILPRWYTDPLRAHSRGISTTGLGQRLSFPYVPDTAHLTHEHEMLEDLFNDVWSNRFINPTPTSMLPGYFGAFFERVLSPPISAWLSPPFAPFAPIPGVHDSVPSPLSQSMSFPSNDHLSSHSLGSGGHLLSTQAVDQSADSLMTSPSTTLRTSVEGDISPSPSVTSLQLEVANVMALARRDSVQLENASTISLKSHAGSYSSGGSGSSKTGKRPSVMLLQSPDESSSMGGEKAAAMIPVDSLQAQEEHSQYMHLYRSVMWVMSVKEAMWDELLVRVNQKDPRLRRYGWTDEDYNEQASRAKFDFAVELYQSDMRGRISLWNCAVQNGWDMPPRDAPSKAEVFEEMQLRREIMEAQRLADTGESEPPCRRFRILIGHKET